MEDTQCEPSTEFSHYSDAISTQPSPTHSQDFVKQSDSIPSSSLVFLTHSRTEKRVPPAEHRTSLLLDALTPIAHVNRSIGQVNDIDTLNPCESSPQRSDIIVELQGPFVSGLGVRDISSPYADTTARTKTLDEEAAAVNFEDILKIDGKLPMFIPNKKTSVEESTSGNLISESQIMASVASRRNTPGQTVLLKDSNNGSSGNHGGRDQISPKRKVLETGMEFDEHGISENTPTHQDSIRRTFVSSDEVLQNNEPNFSVGCVSECTQCQKRPSDSVRPSSSFNF